MTIHPVIIHMVKFAKKLCDLEIKEQIEKLTESFGIPTGFIGNEEFIDSIINKIIELCEY